MRRWLLISFIFLGALLPGAGVGRAQAPGTHRVAPGDTWTALAWRYGVSRAALAQYINLDDIDPLAVSVVYLLLLPEAFTREWPELRGKLGDILGTYTPLGHQK